MMNQKSKTAIIRKEMSINYATLTFLDAEQIDPHRSLRLNGVSRRCNNDILRQQEEGWEDDE